MPNPRSFNQPDRPSLVESDIAQVANSVLALTREVWVLTDRLATMEAVLARRGIDISAEMESFQPDAAMQIRLDQRGQALVAGVVGAMAQLAPEITGR